MKECVTTRWGLHEERRLTLDRLEITPFAVIVGDLLRSRDTGSLTVIHQPLRKVLYWSQGEIVMATSTAP